MSKLSELAEFLEIDKDEIDETTYDDSQFDVGNRSYLVLTEVEAEIRAMDHLTDEDYFWKMAVQAGHTTKGLNDWAQEVIDMDGLGHTLSHYDGSEEETENYIIFRTN